MISSSVIVASVSAINSPVSSSKISSLTNEPSSSLVLKHLTNSSGSFAYFLYNDFKFNSLASKKCSMISLLSLKKSTAF